MNLPQQRQRVTVDGLRNIGNIKEQKSVDIANTKPVEKSAESGIIKEKTKRPITIITNTAIEKVPSVVVSGYSQEECLYIQQQHKELLKYSRDMNYNNEVAFVFRKGFWDRTIKKGEDDNLVLGDVVVGKGNDLFVMHNHPRNSSFSFDDIVEFLTNDCIKSLSIVKNNGNVEVITKLSGFNSKDLAIYLNRSIKKNVKNKLDGEYRKTIDKFLIKFSNQEDTIEWIK